MRLAPPKIWFSVVVALLFSLPAIALGQATAGRTLVMPIASDPENSSQLRVADFVEAALAARGVPLVSKHDARDRVQVRSRAPVEPNTTDLDVLAKEARAALEHVAFGRSAAAKRSVEEVFRRAERALESLNRETKTARNVLDACLALVRSTLGRGNRDDALAEAMRCRRMVPDVSPSEFLHPASVVGVLAEADNQLRRMRIGRLSVQSVPDSGCATFVNGRHLGITPFRLDRAAEGEYRVQVECGSAPGRVHLVKLGDDPVDLVVDLDLDHALRSESRLTLVYDNQAQAARLAARHTIEVARSTRAEEGVIVSVSGDYAELTRVGVAQGAVLGRARVPWLHIDEESSPELDHALTTLFEGRIESDLAVVATVQPSPPAEAAQAPPSQPAPAQPAATSTQALRTKRFRIAAGTLAAAGVGLMAAGIAFEMQRARADDRLFRLDPSDPEMSDEINQAQDDYDRDAGLRWLGVGGGALLLAAVPMLRVDVSQGVPWWSYVIGGAGLGLGAWGAVELAKHGDCEIELTTGGCANRRESAGRGGLLLAAAAPLMAFPIDHLIEWKLQKRPLSTQASLTMSRNLLLLAVRQELP